MPPTAKLLEPGFTTADAATPDLTLRDDGLVVEFLDWQEKRVVVAFADVAGVRWDECGSHGPEDRDDQIYEIVDSEWVANLVRSGARTAGEGHRHFKLCFNAYGSLEVLATDMRRIRDGAV